LSRKKWKKREKVNFDNNFEGKRERGNNYRYLLYLVSMKKEGFGWLVGVFEKRLKETSSCSLKWD